MVLRTLSLLKNFDKPKSAILTGLSSLLLSMTMFSSLRSRCTMPVTVAMCIKGKGLDLMDTTSLG